MDRSYDREADEIRPVKIELDFLRNAKSSAMISCGNTRILIAISLVGGAPRWKKEQGIPGGWITSEYGMMPGSTLTRKSRPKSKQDGRAVEIQRLIGRSLRAVVNVELLGDNSIYVDCDVIDADGGTRCASITGASVALMHCFNQMLKDGDVPEMPMKELLGAVSVGMVDGRAVCDLDYKEDYAAAVDMNVVMTESNQFVEIQGTGEETTFSKDESNQLLGLAEKGIADLIQIQKDILG
ncbi:MAG: ribonuclease PH [Lentisphaeria bacterium]|nr:ribonuclease PH [Lentisphaeria bacterium]NQZ67162.1 ribonuclease PH [Lentisphaeria bacterium]